MNHAHTATEQERKEAVESLYKDTNQLVKRAGYYYLSHHPEYDLIEQKVKRATQLISILTMCFLGIFALAAQLLINKFPEQNLDVIAMLIVFPVFLVGAIIAEYISNKFLTYQLKDIPLDFHPEHFQRDHSNNHVVSIQFKNGLTNRMPYQKFNYGLHLQLCEKRIETAVGHAPLRPKLYALLEAIHERALAYEKNLSDQVCSFNHLMYHASRYEVLTQMEREKLQRSLESLNKKLLTEPVLKTATA